MNPVHTTNFIPEIEGESCNGCGKCVVVCPVEAMSLISANDPHRPKMKLARLEEDLCLGCLYLVTGQKCHLKKLSV